MQRTKYNVYTIKYEHNLRIPKHTDITDSRAMRDTSQTVHAGI